MHIFPKESSVRSDPAAWAVVEHLHGHQTDLGLEDALIFYSFPLFREDEQLLVADLVIVSPLHGVLLISTPTSNLQKAREQLDGAFNQIFSRLVRYPRLRHGRAQLQLNIDACVWLIEGQATTDVLVGFAALESKLDSIRQDKSLSEEVFKELISVLDGSKALIRPRERNTEGYPADTRVNIVSRLEEEIRRFDRDQRVAFMSEIFGPQRIIGLAGSGKTVVLAIKAALTAIREPDASIAITFYTKSLYQLIKRLVTRFYRMHEDRDPDWNKIQILHAWGGATVDGLYYQTARRFGHQPLNFAQARALAPQQPFGAACARLLADTGVRETFDYVFMDEAQDFPPEFRRLALRLAVEQKLVIAYDVFQTIFDVDVPTAATLFGVGSQDEPKVEFEEEIVLEKCYRNPREILVCSHAVGFGIYGTKTVQMLESKEHWKDFGYEVEGELVPGKPARVVRPRENSPSSISDSNSIEQIISCEVFNSPREEVEAVVSRIVNDIRVQGMLPDDILVISADDRNAGMYLDAIESALQGLNISVNNIHRTSYGVHDFKVDGSVTLSTVYKAKGNEAYSVYLVGIDALFYRPTPRTRNCAFTAMTRAKGWLFVSGIGNEAANFARELEAAKRIFPALEFIFPTDADKVFMKRDLVRVEPDAVDEEISLLGENLEPDEFERILRKKLKEVQSGKRTRKRKQLR